MPNNVTGTQVAYYRLCHRKLWLFANDITMEWSSELVAEGRLVDRTSYPQRAERWQAIELEGIKIDHFDAQRGIVREVKKSAKREEAHAAQLKYYLWVMEQHGIEVSHGVLEYPKLKQSEEVWLTETDRLDIPKWVSDIRRIVADVQCPPKIRATLCKHCAYHDFCYADEAS